ncbi:MAG: chloride channel protein [Clostridia bacterium]
MNRIVRWIIMALLTGPLAAIGATIMVSGVSSLSALLTPTIGFYAAPIVGALMAAAIIRRQPSVAGTGSDIYIASLKTRSLSSNPASILGKIGATILVVGSGGSGGLAGPALHVGAGLHVVFHPILELLGKVDDRDERTLRIVGAAGLLGAITGAPLASGLLTIEILHRNHVEYGEMVPSILGAISGAVFYGWIGGETSTVSRVFADPTTTSLFAAIVAALIAGGGGFLLTRMLKIIHRIARHRVSSSTAIVVGASVTGLIALLVGPEILGWGVPRAITSYAISPSLGFRGFTLLLGKILATAATVGSGGSGGVIGPSLVMGAFAGNGVAILSGTCVASASAAGMAAALAAISNVPIAAGIMMIEIFGSAVSPYAALGSVIGFVMARSTVAYSYLPGED